MNPNSNLKLTANPNSIRIFWGYKKEGLEKATFYKELGETFMPGTPYVLAPLGLNGYLPAVLNLDSNLKLPDEVALIVYPTVDLYNEARQNSLVGRIYTYSHEGVFDMKQSRGQFPGTLENPVKHNSIDRWAWYVSGGNFDWQRGNSRLLALSSTKNVFEILLSFSKDIKSKLNQYEIEEIIITATTSFATVWFYSQKSELTFDLNTIGLPIQDLIVVRDLNSKPFYLRNGNEALKIEDAIYVQYKFPRESKFYI
ncbi:hypothetical protein GXP67_00960 [Rhodocytophaga rosea]|uniref:Uncharacterized protein n=1 Tax=Rhodocytophaga rosea TaxID=2704465 RepID=A0A6C0GBZ6_9BACT|nr:hypothetical protein [Rhodocytophaga rosea]QHT65342.1 hypothetical protein GXP67_00960 [Rhodocytophaga rosea]